jgi:hypothetical protein
MGVQEALDARVTNFKDEVASGLVIDPKKLSQQIELSLSHCNAGEEKGAILLGDALASIDKFDDFVLLGLEKINQSSGCFLLSIFCSGKSDIADSLHAISHRGLWQRQIEQGLSCLVCQGFLGT